MNVRALLELCRISNLPTVWSNAVVGYFAGIQTWGIINEGELLAAGRRTGAELIESITFDPIKAAALLIFLIIPYSLLYSGGMILNDYIDRAVDAKERASRPIPSGRINPNTAFWLATGTIVLGVCAVRLFEYGDFWLPHTDWWGTIFAFCLAGAIISYNLAHQRTAKSVLLMGLCRGLVVISAACVMQPPVMHWQWWLFIAAPALTLVIYTVLISLVARREVEHAAQRRRFAGPKAIMNMIAAMPLLDAVWLLVMGLWPASLFCVLCAGLTKLGHRKVAGS